LADDQPGFVMLVYWLTYRTGSRDNRAARVARLTTALSEALQVIDSINFEVLEGQRSLEALERDIASSRTLAGMSDEQRVEMGSLVRKQLKHERLPQFLIALMASIVAYLLGVWTAHFF
jgi:hypothetical protein